MRIFDRYVVREVLLPFALSMLLLTFLLIIPPVLRDAYPLIAKGVDVWVVARVFVLLLPQALAISVPMAVLLSLLIAFGRLSADREFVAMQSCGVSIYQLLRPLAVIALATTAGTAYIMIIARPDANQAFRELVFKEVASRVENKFQPRVLFTDFPSHVLYARDVDVNHVMHDVFFADTSTPGTTIVSFAREGRFIIDRAHQLVQLQLSQVAQGTTLAAQPEKYDGVAYEQSNFTLDAQTVFKQAPSRNPPEMSIAELRETVAASKPASDLWISALYMIHYNYSIPVACCVLALVALGLGVSNRKDGKLASFAIGFIVVFAYYVLMYLGRAAAFGHVLDPRIAPWLSPVVIGILGVALTIWRARSTDRPMLINWTVNRARPADSNGGGDDSRAPAVPAPPRLFARLATVSVPGLKLLDVYTSRQYVQVFVLSVLSARGIFYISTFIDLAEKLFRGKATTVMLLRFFYYQTPQFLYYIVPIAALVGTLVTIGVMTKNSELIVMRACGMSLYRAATPIVLFALLASIGLFGLQEFVLARANHQADRLEGVIRGWPSQEPSTMNRWISSTAGDLYHYDLFDPSAKRFVRFTQYRFDSRTWRLVEVAYADSVVSPVPVSDPRFRQWTAERGWRRMLSVTTSGSTAKTAVTYLPYEARTLTLEAPEYFKAELPDPVKMNLSELRAHIAQLRASGSPTISAIVQMQRKVAFPFATVIMALLAVPFAVTTGRRGAMYGIGIGIALSIAYWVIFQVFTAMGEGGVLTPTLAAWAPNLLFGVAALYGVLTVRT